MITTPSQTTSSSNESFVKRLFDKLRSERKVTRLVALSLFVFVLFSVLKPEYYLTATNFRTIGFSVPEIALLSLAVMVSFISGGIDLSIISTAGLSSLTVAFIFRGLDAKDMVGTQGLGVVVMAVVVGLLVGALAGAFNGFLISIVGITPILATLGTLTLYNGIAIIITGGEAIYGMPDAFVALGNGTVGGVPISFIVFLGCGFILAVLVNQTALGTRIRLVGANPTASRYSGIDNKRVLMLTYVTCGVLSGVSGVLMASRAASASADYGSSYLLLAIVIAILGGTNPSGGYGTVFGVMLAAITLQMVSSGFNIMRLGAFEYTIAQGVILIGVMVIDVVSQRRRLKRVPKVPKVGTHADGPLAPAGSNGRV